MSQNTHLWHMFAPAWSVTENALCVCALFVCCGSTLQRWRTARGACRSAIAGRCPGTASRTYGPVPWRVLCASLCTFTRLSRQAVNLVCLLPRRGGWLHLGSQSSCSSLLHHVPSVLRALPPTSSQREWVTTPLARRRQHCRPTHRLRHRLLSFRLGMADRTLCICPPSIGRSFQRLHYR